MQVLLCMLTVLRRHPPWECWLHPRISLAHSSLARRIPRFSSTPLTAICDPCIQAGGLRGISYSSYFCSSLRRRRPRCRGNFQCRKRCCGFSALTASRFQTRLSRNMQINRRRRNFASRSYDELASEETAVISCSLWGLSSCSFEGLSIARRTHLLNSSCSSWTTIGIVWGEGGYWVLIGEGG